MTEEEKKIITREKHPGLVAQGHKFAALIKKRKEEVLHNKKTVYRVVLRTVFSTGYTTVYSTVYRTVLGTTFSTLK